MSRPDIEKDHQQSILTARRLIERRPVFLNITTTGQGADAEVIDVALVNARGDVLLDTLVKPGRPIDMFSQVVHGITDEMVAEAPRFDQVWDLQLRELLTGSALRPEQPIVIYNAAQQIRVLSFSVRQYGRTLMGLKPPMCLMELFSQFYGDWNTNQFGYTWKNWECAVETCGLDVGGRLYTTLENAQFARLVLEHVAGQIIKEAVA